MPSPATETLRPDDRAGRRRFPVHRAREVIRQVLHDSLAGVTYHPERVSQLSKEIADKIRSELKSELCWRAGRADAIRPTRFAVPRLTAVQRWTSRGTRSWCRS